MMNKSEIKEFLEQLPDEVKGEIYMILQAEQEARKFKLAVNPVKQILDKNGRKLN